MFAIIIHIEMKTFRREITLKSFLVNVFWFGVNVRFTRMFYLNIFSARVLSAVTPLEVYYQLSSHILRTFLAKTE